MTTLESIAEDKSVGNNTVADKEEKKCFFIFESDHISFVEFMSIASFSLVNSDYEIRAIYLNNKSHRREGKNYKRFMEKFGVMEYNANPYELGYEIQNDPKGQIHFTKLYFLKNYGGLWLSTHTLSLMPMEKYGLNNNIYSENLIYVRNKNDERIVESMRHLTSDMSIAKSYNCLYPHGEDIGPLTTLSRKQTTDNSEFDKNVLHYILSFNISNTLERIVDHTTLGLVNCHLINSYKFFIMLYSKQLYTFFCELMPKSLAERLSEKDIFDKLLEGDFSVFIE